MHVDWITMASLSYQQSPSTPFNGFSESEISHVPADIWIILSREHSATMEIYNELAFDTLESLVSDQYGDPQNLSNHGKIYRGQVDTTSDTFTADVTITFFKSTSLVRIQSSGYALWISKVLPKLASKVMDKVNTQSLNGCTSTPVITNQSNSSYSGSPSSTSPRSSSMSSTPINTNMYNLIQSMISASEEKARYEMENKMLHDRVSELTSETVKLRGSLTEKEVQINAMSCRVTELDLVQFEAECDRQLLEATEAKFTVERQQLLLQIQELTQKSTKYACTCSSSTIRSYSEVVASPAPHTPWSTVSRKTSKPTVQPTTTSTPANTANRFSPLADELDENTTCISIPALSPKINSTKKPAPRQDVNKPQKVNGRQKSSSVSQRQDSQHQKARPQVVILGDSISKRINAQRLSRTAKVDNLSMSGRRVEHIYEDIMVNKLLVSSADSIIVHVGTNNLKSDSVDLIKRKLVTLCDKLKAEVSSNCEVALSSIIPRPDMPSKVDLVNEIMHDICENNRWEYIDNTSVRNLMEDRLHPDNKGLSFLARNYQDFLRCAHPHLFHHGNQQHQREPPVGKRFPPWMNFLLRMSQDTMG
jgi:hypothetical protein